MRTCGLGLAAAAAVCLSSVSDAQTVDLARGRQVAEQLCSRCHAVSERGESPQKRVIPFRNLSERYPVDMLVEAAKSGVISGHDEMPMFEVGLADVRNLVGYIDSLAGDGPKYLPSAK